MPIDFKAVHPQYTKNLSKWRVCRDCYDGEDAVKSRKGTGRVSYRDSSGKTNYRLNIPGTAYLPALDGQEEPDYQDYLTRAEFYEATGRTVDALRGMILDKAPQIVAPDAIVPHLEDVTLTGIDVNSFIEWALDETLVVGRLGLLLDYPLSPEGAPTLDQAEKSNLRPFWTLFTAENILDWRSEWRGNRSRLVYVLLQTEDEAIRKALVLDDAGQYQQIDAMLNEKGDWIEQPAVIPKKGGKPFDAIPFYFAGPKKSGPQVEKAPLYALCKTNIAHYRNSADYERGLHIAATPTPCAAGFRIEADETLTIGSKEAWVADAPDARSWYLEFTGAGLGALEKAMDRKESRMAALGSRVLAPEKRQVETAETAALHRTGEVSMLSNVAANVERLIDWALKEHADWMGASRDEAYCKINREFNTPKVDPQILATLFSGYSQGVVTEQMLHSNLTAMGLLDSDITEEDYSAYLQSQPKLSGSYGGFGGFGG